MAKAPVNKVGRRKKAYDMPDRLPEGEILVDRSKKRWKLGPSIGVGGFGEIYSAAEASNTPKKTSAYSYVIKIEPHENGPLFVEMHFYSRVARSEEILEWCAKKKLASLGMPPFIGSGSHECNGKKYRFIVMERYGKDLWSILKENNRELPYATVFHLAVQMLDVLEYIHSKGYIHADLKGANILMGLSKDTQHQAYLVDFGLASHYTTKEFKPDPKKAHNGTIEYTSRDAHLGVATRRGDLEILGYNMIQWMGCELPWESKISDPTTVQASKEAHMSKVSEFLEVCFGEKEIPVQLQHFITCINNMKHDSAPDYKKLRSLLVSGIEHYGGSLTGRLEFTSSPKSQKRKAVVTKPVNGVIPRAKRATKKSTEVEIDIKENGANELFTPEMLRIRQKMEEKKGKTGAKASRIKSAKSETDKEPRTRLKRVNN